MQTKPNSETDLKINQLHDIDLSIRDYFFIIRFHYLKILFFTIVGLIISIYSIITLPPSYTATATVATSTFSSDEVEFIGNGLYITDAVPFNVSTPSGELLNIITSECQDVSNLPTQCKHGYVVKVRNGKAEEDDYYVKFFGENNRDGPVTW